MTRRLLPALAVAAALVLASCGSDEPGATVSQGPSSTGATTSTTTGAIGRGSNGFEGTDGGASSSPTAPDPDSSVSTEPGPDDPGAEPEMVATEVPDRHDLVSPRAVTPTELVVDQEDPTKVHVRFYGGVPECYGAEATVAETAEAVVVTLRTGSIPDAAEACIDLAQYQQITLALDAPLGDRTLEATPGG